MTVKNLGTSAALEDNVYPYHLTEFIRALHVLNILWQFQVK